MDLPQTIMSPYGLTVEGAGPELLRELLAEYGSVLQRTSPHIWASMAPGLTRGEIVRSLEEVGLPAQEELIVWWTWRNGHIPMVPHGLGFPQYSLHEALRYREDDEDFAFELLPSPSWLRIAGQGLKYSVGVNHDPELDALVVRGLSPEHDGLYGLVTHGQAISICTFMTWHLLAIEEGWNAYDPSTGFWRVVQPEKYPLEWLLTGLV
jgi:hypothetical protein